MSRLPASSSDEWVVVRGKATGVASRVLAVGNNPNALAELRFTVSGVPAVVRAAPGYAEIGEKDEVIVVGNRQDTELWVSYWWSVTKARGHVPSTRLLAPSVICATGLFVSLVALILWRPDFALTPVCGAGVLGLLISLSLVQLGRRQQKAAALIAAARDRK
jgi:hypothetical protein